MPHSDVLDMHEKKQLHGLTGRKSGFEPISSLKIASFQSTRKNILGFHLFSFFHRDPNHLSVPYHYYEPLGPDECTMYISHERGRKGSHHRFLTEKRVFENWARTFHIRFFQPDWEPQPLPAAQPEAGPLAWARTHGHTHPPRHLPQQRPLGLWASTAAWRRRVPGRAAAAAAGRNGMEEQHTPPVLAVKLYEPSLSPFGAIWRPVCVCDSWNTTWVSLRDL